MRGATFWFIFVTLLLDMLAIGIVRPIFPKLIIQLEGGSHASAATMLGLLARCGRRCSSLLAGLGFGAAAFAIYGLAASGLVFRVGIVVGDLFGQVFAQAISPGALRGITLPAARRPGDGVCGGRVMSAHAPIGPANPA